MNLRLSRPFRAVDFVNRAVNEIDQVNMLGLVLGITYTTRLHHRLFGIAHFNSNNISMSFWAHNNTQLYDCVKRSCSLAAYDTLKLCVLHNIALRYTTQPVIMSYGMDSSAVHLGHFQLVCCKLDFCSTLTHLHVLIWQVRGLWGSVELRGDSASHWSVSRHVPVCLWRLLLLWLLHSSRLCTGSMTSHSVNCNFT